MVVSTHAYPIPVDILVALDQVAVESFTAVVSRDVRFLPQLLERVSGWVSEGEKTWLSPASPRNASTPGVPLSEDMDVPGKTVLAMRASEGARGEVVLRRGDGCGARAQLQHRD